MKLKLMGIISSLLIVAGCQTAPYKTQYTLNTNVQGLVQTQVAPKPYGIIISEVKTFGGGANVDMTYSREANVVEAYTKSAWIEPPTKLIQVAIANAFIQSNGYRDVLLSPTAISAPYKVETSIQKMQQYFDHNQSFVELSLLVRLVDASSQKLLFSQQYSVKEPVLIQNAQGGVEAYNRALDKMLPTIVRDIARQK